MNVEPFKKKTTKQNQKCGSWGGGGHGATFG